MSISPECGRYTIRLLPRWMRPNAPIHLQFKDVLSTKEKKTKNLRLMLKLNSICSKIAVCFYYESHFDLSFFAWLFNFRSNPALVLVLRRIVAQFHTIEVANSLWRIRFGTEITSSSHQQRCVDVVRFSVGLDFMRFP